MIRLELEYSPKQERTDYLCDALLNTHCRKANCYLNNLFAWAVTCRYTTKPEFALRDGDGNPITVPRGMGLMDMREEVRL